MSIAESDQNSHLASKQLTIRSVVLGLVVAIPLGAANLYMTLKIGWSFGISVISCVVSYAVFAAIRSLSSGNIASPSILEHNCMQTTASAAGYATGGTMAIAFTSLLLANGTYVPWPWMFVLVLLSGWLGVVLTIPLKRQIIDIEELPFPDGVATSQLLQGLHERSAAAVRQTVVLGVAAIAGAVTALSRAPAILVDSVERLPRWLSGIKRVPNWLQIPPEVSLPYGSPFIKFAPRGLVEYAIEPSLLLIGAGLLIGTRIAISMLLGGFLLYFVVGPWLVSLDATAGADATPAILMVADGVYVLRPWATWAGAAILLAASLTSFLLRLPVALRAFRGFAGSTAENADANDPIPLRWFWWGIGLLGPLLILASNLGAGLPIIAAVLVCLLAVISAVIAGRVVGETNTNPAGPIAKIGQVTMALTVPQSLSANVLGAGISSGAGGTAADMLQDLKAGKLLGASARQQFIAQLIGCVGGAILVTASWWLLFPTPEAAAEMSPPAAVAWSRIAQGFTDGIGGIHVTARWASLIAILLGVTLAVLEYALPRFRRLLPSAIGLGFAWVMPFSMTITIAIGGLIAGLWLLIRRRSAERDLVPAAAGLVAGASIIEVVVLLIAAIAAAQIS